MIRRDKCPLCDSAAMRFYSSPRGETFVQCQACGLVYQRRVASKAAQRQWYNQEWRAPSEAVERQNRGYAQRFLRPKVPGMTLLEIGSNSGAMLAELRGLGYRVLGVEPAGELASLRPDLPVVIGFFENAKELKGRMFDVIVSFHVLEHVEHPVRFARLVRSKLNPGGLWFNYMPNLDTWRLGKPWIHVQTKHLGEHVQFFNASTAKLLCQRVGFDIFQPGAQGDDLYFYAGVM